jgi:hypothetical protein
VASRAQPPLEVISGVLEKRPGTVGKGRRQGVSSKLFLLPFYFLISFFSLSKGCRAEIIYFRFE